MAHSQSSSPTSFNRSSLVQLLTSLQIPRAADSAQTFADQLSHWVAWKDAITLSSALDATPIVQSSVEPMDVAAANRVIAQVRQVREDLVAAFAHDALLADDAPREAGQITAAITTVDEPQTMELPVTATDT